MKSREEIIEELESTIDVSATENSFSIVEQWAVRDAVKLLKAQEARVLTFDEARDHAMQVMNPDSIKPVFVEFRVKLDSEEEERPPWRGGYNQRVMLANQKDRYEIDFRFWTDRPTIAQMEATPWKT